MKQIVPFEKELPFKTKVSDITSISLERDLEIKEEGVISGVFYITGDYKMNEGSINREDFSFDLPFDITLDPRYDIRTVKSDIDDFNYDVIDGDKLKVNIDLYVEAEYLPDTKDRVEEDPCDEVVESEIIEITPLEVEESPIKEEDKERDDDFDNAIDLFSNLDNQETYSTYYVYIVKEDDTVDNIVTKYSITREDFENYNDINNIKPGDKVIIPKVKSE